MYISAKRFTAKYWAGKSNYSEGALAISSCSSSTMFHREILIVFAHVVAGYPRGLYEP